MAQPREDGAFQRVLAEAAAATAPSSGLPAGEQPLRSGRLTQPQPRPVATRGADLRSRLEVPERTRSLLRVTLTVALFAGVLATVGGLLAVELTHHPRASAPAPAADPAPTAAASTASAAPRPPARRAAGPFLGSPAQSYAAGPAGIVPPAPHRVGRYSRAQVSRAYAVVKQLLIAAHLDRRTLLGGRPDAFARLLPPAERRYFSRHLGRRGLTPQGWPLSSREWVTSFAPGSVQLAAGTIKVRGGMHATAAARSGNRPVLRVKADYLFVYAVQRPGRPGSRMRVVVRDVAWVDFGHWDRWQGPLEPWWSPHGGGTAGGQCGTRDGFIHPAFPGGRPGRTRPSGTPVDPYDQSVPPSGQGCRPTTGT